MTFTLGMASKQIQNASATLRLKVNGWRQPIVGGR